MLYQRGILVVEVVFFLIEFVKGVDGVADVGYRVHRVDVGDYFFALLERSLRLSERFRPGEVLRRRVKCSGCRLDVDSLIRHIAEFHIDSSVKIVFVWSVRLFIDYPVLYWII